MTQAFLPALRPDFYGQLAATDPYQSRSRRLFERGQVVAVSGNEADVRVGYNAQGNALEVKQVPIMSGYVPAVGDWVSIQYEAGHSSAPWITGPSMAAGDSSDSAGIGVFPVRESEPDDPPRSAIYFDSALASWRGWDGAEWVEFAGRLHNSLPDLQGGTAGEYYHLTEGEYASVQDLSAGGHLEALKNYPYPARCVLYADADGSIAADAGLVWDAASNRVGIGTASPDGPLHIVKEAYEALTSDLYTSASPWQGPTFNLRRARGTLASPAAVLNGDQLLRIVGSGYHGAGFYAAGYLIFVATEDWGVNRGTRLDLQGVPTGSAGTVIMATLKDYQWLLTAGSAAAPALARMSYDDDGFFWPGDGLAAVTLGGAERWRWSGNNVGLASTGRIYGDGVACSGDTYLRERAANIWCLTAGGNDQFEVRADHQYVRPTTYDPAADGEFSLETDNNAWKHRIGSVVHRNGWCVYSGSPVEDTTGNGNERTLDSFTIPAAYWKVGKRLTILATVLAEIEGPGKSVTLRLKLGSTVAMAKTISGASAPTWRSGHFDFEMTFVVGAIAGSGTTIYPARTIRGFTSQSHADFNVIKTVATHELYPMEPDTPGLAIATDAAQTVSMTQQTNAAGVSMHLRLQGLTIYST